jgi:two-component system OmpR family response regulator
MRRTPTSSSRRRIYTRALGANTDGVAIEVLQTRAGGTLSRLALRVLIAQDDPRLGPVLVSGLEANGMLVDLVSTAAEAIIAASTADYSVIVLDAVFVDADGFSVCEELRARGVDTPIVFLTARDSIDDRVRGLEVGADDYLGKPFAIRELTARMHALARRAAVVHPLVLQCGDLRLHRVQHQAQRGTVPIGLSRREFDVLETLMHQPGVVLSRNELLDRAWGDGHMGPANVVDVYIGYLRRKIDRPFDRQSLQTIRGAGYRIADDA